MSDFVAQLTKDLIEKRSIAATTADGYMKVLYAYSPAKPFKNLAFLRKTDEVMKKMSEYAESTQKTHLASITSVLSIVKDKPAYKRVYDFYYGKMMEKAKPENEAVKGSGEKSETQKENWLTWEEVKKRREDLAPAIKALAPIISPNGTSRVAKPISSDQFDALRDFTILSLYTDTQPRRNQDYQNCYVVKKWTPEMPTDKNYLDMDGGKIPKQFIFNVYKTAKKYGQQKCDIPASLQETLTTYIYRHPLRMLPAPIPGTPRIKRNNPNPYVFLCDKDGGALTSPNAITRVLNRIFGKKIGSSMLRHIFLSDKYDIEEMKEDATAMGHSLNQQREYLKSDAT